ETNELRARAARRAHDADHGRAASADRTVPRQGSPVDAQRDRRAGALQRRLERDRPARRVGAGGLRRRRPAARCAARGRAQRGGHASVARRAARGRAPVARAAPSRVRVSEAEERLAVAGEAARMAGGLLSARAGQGAEREVRAKSTPTDLVSEADISSEHAIRELLATRRPRDGFVGEEQGGGDAGDSGLQWVVDPLDGTINYLFGIPQWCVSVAVCDRERTLAGAIYDPNRDELFTATCESAPMLARGERAEPLDRSEASGGGVELSKAMLATGLAYDARVRAAQARVLARAAPRARA